MAKEVLVVNRKKLFPNGAFHGFVSVDNRDFGQLIFDNFEYKLRDEQLEINPAFKQIIPYVVIVNPSEKKVFGYKRFKKAPGLHEMRLHDKFSFGVGGHVDKNEIEEDVVFDAMMRELKEEVKMENYPIPNVIGFLNDDTNDVGEVHFGIVAIAETTENVNKVEGDEVKDEKFYSIEEIEEMMKDEKVEVENWTKLSWDAVKEYLKGF